MRQPKWISFDKKLALKWLKSNSHNRHIRSDTVHKMALDMKSGRWKEEASDLIRREKADSTGEQKIADGQHRLWAVVEADVPIRFLVLDNCEPEVQGYVDCGTMRSIGDRLRLSDSVPDYATNASYAKLYAAVLRYFFAMPSTDKCYKPSWGPATVVAAQKLIGTHLDFAFGSIIGPDGRIPTHLKKGGIFAAIARAHACKVSDDVLIAFASILNEGQDSDLRSAHANRYVRTVRDGVINKRYCRLNTAGRADAQYLYFMIARAIHCFDTDDRLSRISIKIEDIYPRSRAVLDLLRSITPQGRNGESVAELNARLVAGEEI